MTTVLSQGVPSRLASSVRAPAVGLLQFCAAVL